MSERVKILHVISGMGNGGAETFLMNMYRVMDHEKIQFDFLLSSDENAFKDELNQYGSEIYTITKYTRNPIKNAIELARFFKTHSYSIVHVHANSLMTVAPLFFAKKARVPCRIMHSHSTRVIHKLFYPVHWFHKSLIDHLATAKFACSKDAGEWMFPSDYLFIRNAIDISQYRYNPESRVSIRESLGITDNVFVVGHVGRFFPAKNHRFILDVFNEMVKYNKDAILLLVGDGGQEVDVRNWVIQKGLSNNVKFLGMRMDVHNLLSAFDVFLFPSIYEGFGIALLEAQANGVPIFCSTNISEESILTPYVRRLPLSAGPKYWAEAVLFSDLTRNDYSHFIKDAGFEIRKEAQKMQQFYLSQTANRS